MALIDVDWNPAPGKLRQFGGLVAIGCAVGVWAAVTARWGFAEASEGARIIATWAFAAVGGFSLLASLALPSANRLLYVVLTAVTLPVGFVVSYLLLAAVFFLVLVPARIALAVFRVDPMRRRASARADSYWVRSRTDRSKESYFHQY